MHLGGNHLSLTAKIALAIILIFVAALGMTTMLNYMRFEQTLRTVLTQRINVIANETAQDLRAAIDIGLRLENMENLDGILMRRLGMSDEIAEMSVRDCTGNLISGELSRQGGTVSTTPVQTGGIQFNDAIALLDTKLEDSLGKCAGSLRLTADLSVMNGRLESALAEMMKSAGIGMVAVLPILCLLLWLMNRRHRVFVSLNNDVKRAILGQNSTDDFHDRDLLTESEIEMVALYRDIRKNLRDGTSSDAPSPTNNEKPQ